MNNKTAYLVGAGAFCPDGLRPGPGDAVIAADGGLSHLSRAGIRADWLLGDMDSLKSLPTGPAILRFPVKKDQTDLALAILLARRLGYRRFKLYGALGGRLDHSLANLHLLCGLAREGLRACVVDRSAVIHAVHQGRLDLPPLPAGSLVSVFAWGGQARGVSLRGLDYPLNGAALSPTNPLGVSNRASGRPASVTVLDGTLLVMLIRGNQE